MSLLTHFVILYNYFNIIIYNPLFQVMVYENGACVGFFYKLLQQHFLP